MKLEELSWLSGKGPDAEIALSTRLRLARNLEDFPFPPGGAPGHLAQVVTLVGVEVEKVPGLAFHQVYSLKPLDLHLLVERHLISPAFMASNQPRGLALSPDGQTAIMINEEDHLRLQCLVPGLDFATAWGCVSGLEEQLAEGLRFAFDAQFGYLTSCPSNVGTGLRASAMLHLPALAWLKALDNLVPQVAQVGLTVRGVFGEGSRSAGNLLQISNQVTLGPSEEDILANLGRVTSQLVGYERSARQELLRTQGSQLEDRVWRCLGVLASARLMVSAEAMEHLSMVRLGVDLGFLPPIPLEDLNALMVRLRPASLQVEAGRDLEPGARDSTRAELLREALGRYVS